MGVPLKKLTAADQPQIQIAGAYTRYDIAVLVDEIGSLLPAAEQAQKRIKMLQAGLNPIREKIRTLTTLVTADPRHDPNETFTVEGQQFLAIVGKCAKLRAVRNVSARWCC